MSIYQVPGGVVPSLDVNKGRLDALTHNLLYDVDKFTFHDETEDSRYTVAGDGLATLAVTAPGFLTLIPGAGGTSAVRVHGSRYYWKGDVGFSFSALVTLPNNLMGYKLEVGMVSDHSQAAGQINSKATPTDYANDYAVVIYDEADDSDWALIGAKATNIEDQQNNPGGVAPPKASTQYLIQLICQPVAGVGDVVTGYINGVSMGGVNIEGGTDMTWSVLVKESTATAKNVVLSSVQMVSPISTSF